MLGRSTQRPSDEGQEVEKVETRARRESFLNSAITLAAVAIALTSFAAAAQAGERGTKAVNDDPAVVGDAAKTVGTEILSGAAGKAANSLDTKMSTPYELPFPHPYDEVEPIAAASGVFSRLAKGAFIFYGLANAANDLDPTAAVEVFFTGLTASVAAAARILLTPVQGPTDAEIWMDNNPPTASEVPWQSDDHPHAAQSRPPSQRNASSERKPQPDESEDHVDMNAAYELLSNAGNQATEALDHSSAAARKASDSAQVNQSDDFGTGSGAFGQAFNIRSLPTGNNRAMSRRNRSDSSRSYSPPGNVQPTAPVRVPSKACYMVYPSCDLGGDYTCDHTPHQVCD